MNGAVRAGRYLLLIGLAALFLLTLLLLALLLLAHSLGRRKRRAWALATGLTVASILLQLAHGRQLGRELA